MSLSKEQELKLKEDALAAKEAALKVSERRLFATKALRKLGLNESLLDLVMSDSEDEITKKVNLLKKTVGEPGVVSDGAAYAQQVNEREKRALAFNPWA